nr:outer envelope protein 64, mitochondrial-like [Arachis hypogaea]
MVAGGHSSFNPRMQIHDTCNGMLDVEFDPFFGCFAVVAFGNLAKDVVVEELVLIDIEKHQVEKVTVPLEQFSVASYSLPLPDTDGNIETSELLKEKGNAAFKGSQWNKALNYYTEAIKLNGMNATYYCNRAAAYLKLA